MKRKLYCWFGGRGWLDGWVGGVLTSIARVSLSIRGWVGGRKGLMGVSHDTIDVENDLGFTKW